MMIYSESRPIEKGMYYGTGKDLILQARALRKEMTCTEKVLWERCIWKADAFPLFRGGVGLLGR